jgi:hypothetical protein
MPQCGHAASEAGTSLRHWAFHLSPMIRLKWFGGDAGQTIRSDRDEPIFSLTFE